MASTHDYQKDSRNKDIKIYINGKHYNRSEAKVSVFESGFLLGDGVWSGIRYHNNKFLFLKEHLERLFQSAKGISLDIPLTKKEIINQINSCPLQPIFFVLNSLIFRNPRHTYRFCFIIRGL